MAQPFPHPESARPRSEAARAEARRRERAEAAAAVRRRELARRYPDVPVRTWSRIGLSATAGLLDGVGPRAMRDWLASLEALLQAAALRMEEPSGTSGETQKPKV